jgi:class 3 adenylate cyclase
MEEGVQHFEETCMICPNCQTENPEVARFCLNCGVSLAMQCPNCQTELPTGARFCMNCGQPLRASTPADDARLIRLAAATPDPLAEKVRAAEHLPGERRVVTVLFADVVGSTALAGQVDAETWMAIMNGAFDRITPAIYRYEGTIARLVGDGLWAFFGAPVAHEDDPLRAVRAAVGLLEAARVYAEQVRHQYGVEFLMRACLNTGPVVVGPVGDDLRYEYTAMGGTVNLAARLKFAAQPMTVLITESTHRFVTPVFDTEEVGQIEVKGQAEPVRVYRVHGAKAEPGSLRGLVGLESPMVGREKELAALMHLCEAVRAGLGRAALIVGEPGLGKTRLIAEWKAVAQEHLAGPPAALWAEGCCLSYGQGLAYHLLLDLLRSIIGVPDRADEPETRAALLAFTKELFGEEMMGVYPYLGHLLMLRLEDEALQRVATMDPQALQTQYLGALRKLLLAIAARRPLILILEDMHWADPSSTDLLIRLLPLASAASLLFCIVARPDREAPGWRLILAAREILGGSLTEITLDALSDTESRQLVANLLEIEALSGQARNLILNKAEGNPFFVEEVIRMMIDRGVIARRDGGWIATADIRTLDIPDNLQGLLMARIDRLPDDVKRTLRVAAVIGRQFPVKVLAHVLEGE